MVFVRIEQRVKVSVDGITISAVATFESPNHPDIIKTALEETAKLGIFSQPTGYDRDRDAFFVNLRPSEGSAADVEGVALLINDQIWETTAQLTVLATPDHHGDRERHAELG